MACFRSLERAGWGWSWERFHEFMIPMFESCLLSLAFLYIGVDGEMIICFIFNVLIYGLDSFSNLRSSGVVDAFNLLSPSACKCV